MERILVSACLLGSPVRFDGRAKTSTSGLLERWKSEGRIVPVCPEVAGGLPVPRPPAELSRGSAGLRVLTIEAADVTEAFERGAHEALGLARQHGIRIAILKARSPSCGSRQVYDGSFSGTLVDGEGLTTRLLRAHGITVFSEEELDAAEAHLQRGGQGTAREVDATSPLVLSAVEG